MADFECGPENWAIEVSNWIKAPSTEIDSASRMISRKLIEKVWLFLENDDTQIVGFTSIARGYWTVEGSGEKIPILHIPYIGIHVDFQGKKYPTTGKSYLRTLMMDLLHEAERRATIKRFHLGLHVQSANTKAIEIYETYGFRKCGVEEIYDRMIVDAHYAHDKAKDLISQMAATPSAFPTAPKPPITPTE